MLGDDNAPLLLGCPGRDDLDAFANGELEPHKQEAVAEHLCGCASCESSLQALRGEGTAVFRLRLQPDPMFLLDATQWEPLAARARAIPAEQPGAATVTDAGSGKHAAEGPPLPMVFGGYVLLERLGRGGMGIVYKARQEALKRMVALKMVRAGVYASPEERTRFRREGEVVARVEHANVVQIYEFSEHEGQLYFSMELLHGGTLESKVHNRPLPEREAAQLVRTLALAVHAAHQQGVVHRDLKPANVLFAADGTVKITDFGLAKVLDADGSDTRSDAILGTPAYMAPEQARGEIRTVGPAADVYALGAILYEALTGRPPFRAETRYQTLELVRTGEPAAPSGLRRGLSRDLEAICLKCLEREPARRYHSAADLAEDLRRWLDGSATQARPLRWHNRVVRVIRRHRPLTATAALLVLGMAALAATFYWRDPERKIEDHEARLRRGQPVTLIGDSGPPAWSAWTVHRPGNVIPSRQGDDVFALSSLDPAMLMLLRDPQSSYRFRAEVRHDNTARTGEVGIYFGHSQHATTRGVQHCYCTLTFNDFEPHVLDRKRGVRASAAKGLVWREDGEPPRCSMPLGEIYFSPAGSASPVLYPWRRLAVEVRPDDIRLFWEEQQVASLTHPQLLIEFNPLRNVECADPRKPFAPFSPPLQPEFTPRDSLGLYLTKGKCSFRRAVVEPLR
jgi:serine/threonine protein kinase